MDRYRIGSGSDEKTRKISRRFRQQRKLFVGDIRLRALAEVHMRCWILIRS